MELKVPSRLDKLFRELRVLERNRKPIEVKVVPVADCMGRST